ncbi:MAG: AMP-dependent synthetase [Betaproteobacteria bacterium]|nr:AMP-dependent synthetase [Betaproteobacteria bacterium]
MLRRTDSYASLAEGFRWAVPAHYNIGTDVCDKWADGSGRLALIFESKEGAISRYSFDDIFRASNRFANVLAARGVAAGDRVGILLPQAPEAAIAHVAVYKSGAIAVPLFVLFGVDALRFRLSDAGVKLLVTDRANALKIEPLRKELPALQAVLCIDEAPAGCESFHDALARASDSFSSVQTSAEEPALIIYTSGTTGSPKGALHAHRALLGHMPGVEMSHDFLGQPGDLIWTPADWAWIGALMDVLMPAWQLGIPVLARRFEKFDPEAALALMRRHQVRNVFLPPTALKMLRAESPSGEVFPLRSLASGGESLGEELLDWGLGKFGVRINEFYGQTECNMVVSSCSTLYPIKPGSIGKVVAGHDVRVVDDTGQVLPRGTQGNIAIRSPDPVMFLRYWNNPVATREKFAGDWLLTGDTGIQDDEGYVRFVGRNDDVITSAGYRIGPGPIEDCLIAHPAVKLAAVIGAPDPQRTEVVKAYVVLKEGFEGSDALVRELQDHVRIRLAAHEYPRQVRFVDSLPLTTTGKIIRRELRGRRW